MSSTSKTKVSVTLPQPFIRDIDSLVRAGQFESRSAAFELAIKTFLREQMDAHIEAQVANLDQALEIAEAEKGMEDYSNLVHNS